MSSRAVRRTALAPLAAAAVSLLAAAAVAAAVEPGGQDTTMAVSPRVLIAAPARSPVDFPGVPRARAGRPLPRGYVAVARDVRITRGGEVAYAALRMACPARRTWRTAAVDGELGASVLDRVVSRKRSVLVMATVDTRLTAPGETATGTIYALCR